MRLEPGSRLGPYEIVSRIGQGGMGEVWRARDTRLDRTVAIKILSDELAHRGELRQRFEREARTISQLNHPHICTLHDVGDGYLVMELLEGETLADRTLRGPMPLQDVVKYGVQIADALDRAHRRGIVHRDLKPGNIMITTSGAKLLDFGLAKPPVVDFDDNDATAQKPLTAEGVILGTLQYMAPEQLEGHEVDARTDIFALGTVLYEMATGRRAFEGKTKISLVAAIVGSEPEPISRIQSMSPRSLDRVVGRCLRKDPEERWQNARDLMFDLRAVLDPDAKDASPSKTSSGRFAVTVAVAAIIGVLLGAAAMLALRPSPLARTERLAMVTPARVSFDRMLAISPDGRSVVFRGRDADERDRLWMRRIDSPIAEPIPGAETGQYPFWSPDGRHLGFFAGGKLNRLDLSNGSIQPICDAGSGGGATWSESGTIVFAGGLEESLQQVSASGGVPTLLTKLLPGEQFHLWPHFLPDGKHYLFFAGGDAAHRGIFAGELGSDQRKLVLPAKEFTDSTMIAYAGGRLYFVKGAALFAQPFDHQRMEVSAKPAQIADQIASWGPGLVSFSIARSGTVAYVNTVAAPPHQLIWYDRTGRELERLGQPGPYLDMSLSPEEGRVALQRFDAEEYPQIWIMETRRGTVTRFTANRSWNSSARFSPDGKLLAWAHALDSPPNPFLWNADGTGEARRLLRTSRQAHPTSWTPDGKWVICIIAKGAGYDVSAVPADGGTPRQLLTSEFNERFAQVSPDGRWLAYTSDESGKSEVYLTTFPEPRGKWRISTDGGSVPMWNPKEPEILYVQRSSLRLHAVRIGSGPVPEPEPPQPLFVVNQDNFAISRDGQRILVNQRIGPPEAPPIMIVTNWKPEDQ